MLKLILLTSACLWASIELCRADDSVHVREVCSNRDCSLVISGPNHSCITHAIARRWNSGLEAAVWIRDCLDRGHSK